RARIPRPRARPGTEARRPRSRSLRPRTSPADRAPDPRGRRELLAGPDHARRRPALPPVVHAPPRAGGLRVPGRRPDVQVPDRLPRRARCRVGAAHFDVLTAARLIRPGEL